MTDKHPGGRPTDYREEYCELGYKLCLLGHTDKELAQFFGVVESTIYLWKKQYPQFSEALKNGKDIADANVATTLYERATGYEIEEEVADKEGNVVLINKKLPPDPTSMIFWLKNRQPRKWRDKHDLEHSGDLTVNIVEFKDDEQDS